MSRVTVFEYSPENVHCFLNFYVDVEVTFLFEDKLSPLPYFQEKWAAVEEQDLVPQKEVLERQADLIYRLLLILPNSQKDPLSLSTHFLNIVSETPAGAILLD